MPDSNEIRRLTAKWISGSGWQNRLESLAIRNLRGWKGENFRVNYPIMAVVGANGSGKSTLLQCAAAIYRSTAPKFFYKGRGYASDYFPKTTWDDMRDVEITYSIMQGEKRITDRIKRPGSRWRGNIERPARPVVYIDLSRILPVPARVGYSKIAKSQHTEVEASSLPFDKNRLARLSQIMGRPYEFARMAIASSDPNRPIPVMGHEGSKYSGFHSGAGETTMSELIQWDLPRNSLVLIDEVETSLHPSVQRQLIRDLADKAKESELQIILTTHSPFVLQELPPEARAQILLPPNGGRTLVYGVSPEFAMSKMDDVPQYECELFMEDKRSQIFLVEVLFRHAQDLVTKCRTIPYGAASVGKALGIMVSQDRLPRPTVVFLDGDQGPSSGCVVLPRNNDPPERVVFDTFTEENWISVSRRIGRDYADVADAKGHALTLKDHHEWLKYAASKLLISSDILWQTMCAEWASKCITEEEVKSIVQPIEDALLKSVNVSQVQPLTVPPGIPPTPVEIPISPNDANEPLPLFELT